MVCRIPLAHGRVAIIDDVDEELLLFRWTASFTNDGKLYVKRRLAPGRKATQTRALHRDVMLRAGETFEGEAYLVVDHMNGDTLDNRRCNLRVCTQAINMRNVGRPRSTNKSGHIGVSFDRARGKWDARIKTDGRLTHLGRFLKLEDAVAARLAAERAQWGIHPQRREAHA